MQKTNKLKQKNNLIKIFLLSLFLGLFFNVSVSRGAINGQINYQGKLTDDSSVAVADGNYDMIISIYDADSGGNCVWTARGTCGTPTARSVAVLNGIFSIMLGDTGAGDTALTGLNFNVPYYLGVTVESDPEMAPRKSIGASGYAFNSSMLNGLSDATSGANAHILATDSSGNATVSGNTYFNGVTYYVNSSGTGNLNGLTLAGDMAVNGGDITSTGALTATPGAGTNFNVVLSGAGDFAVNTNQFYVDTSTARIGIGNSSPSVALHIGATVPTNLGSTADSLMVSGALEVAGSAYLGPMEFPTDSGAIAWIDMPVSASATPNATESYTARIGGTDILTVYGQALGSGAGGIINPRVGIGTTAPTNFLSLDGTSSRTIWMERNIIAATAGQGLILSSGGAISGGTNLAGGDLTLKSGIATGTGTSAMRFYTATAGATGTADRAPTEKMTILGNGNVGIGTVNPESKFSVVDNSGGQEFPFKFQTSDALADYFQVANSTLTDGQFIPVFKGHHETDSRQAFIIIGETVTAQDTGTSPIISFDARRSDGVAVTRPLFSFGSYGNYKMTMLANGNLGLGTTSPTAYLNIKAGTATAGTAPLKFTSGTNLTTAEAGAMEWDGTSLYITNSSAARKTISYTDSAMTGTFDGINLATGTQGGVGYFSSTTQLSSGALGTTGQALISGGTGAPTWFAPTAGSLLFAGTGGILAQDNTNLFWDNTNKRLGIGTISPSAQLHTTGAVRFESFGAGTLVTDVSGNLSVSSDERLKNIDGKFTRGIDELMGINPISFHWKENSGMDMENFYVGFSAQNIQDNIPEAVGIDHRGFLTLSDRPILATVVNSIKGQQGQIAGISQNVSELSSVNQDLILKTDENISTISGLQDLVSENLGKIINQVDLQNQSLKFLQTQTNEHGSKIKSIEDMLVILQNKMDDFQEISNQELILAQMDLNKTDIDYIKMILGLDQTGNPGDIRMGGQLEAQGIVAGAFGVKITDEKNKTIGTVTIKAGDKSASVETEIVNENSKIFVTPDQPVGVGVSSVKNGEGFEIETNIPTEKDLKIDWWIIEEK